MTSREKERVLEATDWAMAAVQELSARTLLLKNDKTYAKFGLYYAEADRVRELADAAEEAAFELDPEEALEDPEVWETFLSGLTAAELARTAATRLVEAYEAAMR